MASLISPGTEKLMIEMGQKSLLGKVWTDLIANLEKNYVRNIKWLVFTSIYLDIDTGYFPGVNHGLASLAATVRSEGHFFCSIT